MQSRSGSAIRMRPSWETFGPQCIKGCRLPPKGHEKSETKADNSTRQDDRVSDFLTSVEVRKDLGTIEGMATQRTNSLYHLWKNGGKENSRAPVLDVKCVTTVVRLGCRAAYGFDHTLHLFRRPQPRTSRLAKVAGARHGRVTSSIDINILKSRANPCL